MTVNLFGLERTEGKKLLTNGKKDEERRRRQKPNFG